MTITVTKRNLKTEPYMVSKIKQVIEWACEGLDVNHLVLESKFDDFVKDRISTTHIHDNLIHHAQSLASPESPDWVLVAGRLQTMRRWKDTKAYDCEFGDFIKSMQTSGYYTHSAIDLYSSAEIETLGKAIVQANDLAHSYGSTLTANKKYLLPGECIQHMFMVNSMIIASVEQPADRVKYALEFYTLLSERKISLATPWLSNLRSGGNISSCFIIAVDDSMDSIADNWKNAALISKLGGGLGIDLSRIRAKGATIGKIKDASGGVCGWAKTFNEIAVNVDQCFHPETIVNCKTGPKKIADVTTDDMVLTNDLTYRQVSKVLPTSNTILKSFKIVTDSAEVVSTESHPVLVAKGASNMSDAEIIAGLKSGSVPYSWVDVKDLKVGDKIIGY